MDSLFGLVGGQGEDGFVLMAADARAVDIIWVRQIFYILRRARDAKVRPVAFSGICYAVRNLQNLRCR
jgi:hypothetical protein